MGFLGGDGFPLERDGFFGRKGEIFTVKEMNFMVEEKNQLWFRRMSFMVEE